MTNKANRNGARGHDPPTLMYTLNSVGIHQAPTWN